MCRLLLQPCTPGVHGKDAASETYNIFKVVVKGYHECSFTVSVGEKYMYVVRRKRGDQGSALKVLDKYNRGQLGHLQCVDSVRLILLSLVIALTEKFLFDYVRLLNQLKNNQTIGV